MSESLTEHAARMHHYLGEAAAQFRFYEKNHREKAGQIQVEIIEILGRGLSEERNFGLIDAERLHLVDLRMRFDDIMAKADVNAQMAERCEEAQRTDSEWIPFGGSLGVTRDGTVELLGDDAVVVHQIADVRVLPQVYVRRGSRAISISERKETLDSGADPT